MRTAHPFGLLTGVVFVLTLTIACSGDTGTEPPRPASPSITAQPQDAKANEGSSVTFSVTAAGTGPLSYQWKRDGSAIAGATAPSYELASVAALDSAARFTVVVSNDVGTAESRQARVEVRTAPAIVSQPEGRAALSGVPAGFSVEATGADLEYQWLRNGAAISGATSSAYFVGVPLAGDDGAVYSVVVKNDLGSVTSQGATLQVRLDFGLRPTSYANEKALNQAPDDLPDEADMWTARAFGDFFGGGNRDLFIGKALYDHDKPASDAIPGEFQFWRWTPSGYVRDESLLADATGCIVPRRVVVADFNGDARPDLFAACHGYDAEPFPGETSRLILSEAGGGYTVHEVGDVGFYHGATAADIDGDGDIDVVVADVRGSKPVYAFVNDGQGEFTARYDLFPVEQGRYFTVEAADVNGDGRVDILAGGHEWENSSRTVVLLSDGSNSFAAVEPVVLPSVTNEGVVLDFAVLDADRNGVNEIYVARTSGGDGTFYESLTVQRVRWPGLETEVILRERPALPAYFLFPLLEGSNYAVALVQVDLGAPASPRRLMLP